MIYRGVFILNCTAIFFSSCSSDKGGDEVIGQRFIHKYGYDVPKDDWETKTYPGRVIETHRDGTTLTTHFEDGLMHGERTRTYPHSQTVESREYFTRGTLTKRVLYDVRGIPTKEENHLSPTHVKVISWYSRGTPKSVEEMINGKLAFAEFYNPANETESRIENGIGTKVIRDNYGDLKAKEVFDSFALVQKETFHPNGTPALSEFYKDGLLHGLRSTYTESGDPKSTEFYREGILNGIASYYQNGLKYLEIPYIHGEKEGIERHYIDGSTLAEETEFHDNRRHGPSVIFYDGVPTTTWYYNNEKVSRQRYEEMCRREDEIRRMNERSSILKNF
jgi:antitoxin component YwqK of YwqJK toxin-antitoxin module